MPQNRPLAPLCGFLISDMLLFNHSKDKTQRKGAEKMIWVAVAGIGAFTYFMFTGLAHMIP